MASELKIDRIVIETIPHTEQRYPTCGDYFLQAYRPIPFIEAPDEPMKTELVIYVSKMADVRSEMAVAIHELIEAALCLQNGISFESIDEFDKLWEKQSRMFSLQTEPGDEPDAPYHKEHKQATLAEMMYTHFAGLSWIEHEANIAALDGEVE